MLLCIAKEALFEQNALKKMRTEVSSQMFYSLSIMLSTVNSFDKASGLPYIFIRINRLSTQTDRLFLVAC